ncbi:MAG: ABC transporter ATP-binding protein [Oscillospiraceae bacterium]|nr:ABC transporter ATP-binding protein [Oscillospiraceae bacterium]
MIELSGITKIYRNKNLEFQALRGVSLTIGEGEFVTVMGRSGCGKSTLLTVLGLMSRFDDGAYLLRGQAVKDMPSREICRMRNRHVGFVFQSYNLINEYSALENIEMPLGYAGVGGAARRRRAKELLETVGLSDKARNTPLQLSGGQQQRVAIARALANRPSLLLADEPTGNLDTGSGQEIMSLFKTLNEQGATILLVTHDPLVASYGNRILHMTDGLIEEE